MTGRKLRLAIFEDRDTDRFIYEETLEPFSLVDYMIFSDPDAGLAMCSCEIFHAVIIPVHFWGSHFGFEIMLEWRSRCINKPFFVATTPLIQQGDRARILATGFHRIIEKPAIYNVLAGFLKKHETKIAQSTYLARQHVKKN